MKVNIAYLAQGKLHLKNGDHAVRIIESKFGQSVKERALEIQQRHSWKSQGRGAQFMSGGLLWGAKEADPVAMRIAITGLAWASSDTLIYALQTDEIAGVFALEEGGKTERRLFHNANYRVGHLHACAEHDLITCALLQEMGTANLAVIRADGTDFFEVTEGDSYDLAPSWIPGSPRHLLFQSAGVARTKDGHFSGYAPFAIYKLNIDTGEMTCLAEDEKYDLLGPRITGDGTLYYIRRPYRSREVKLNAWRLMLDLLLLPLRLLYAIFQFLNFFTTRYTGKPLTSAGGAKQREMDVQQMMVWGNLIQAQKDARHNEDDAPDLVPKSWELVCQHPNGSLEVLQKGILAFDLCRDGTIIYSNGSSIHQWREDGSTERLLADKFIEQVAIG
ncbi:MAG: hypothetical protein HY231_01625 [Acidobacteria bacterium]|nr:hypothetical protein [Acidobacteriota bacterium]